MPSAKTAADGAATKKKKSSKDKDVKEKKEKEKSGSSSKEKEKSDKKENSKKKRSTPTDETDKTPKPSPAPPLQQPQQQYDADAVQLFRRYDRARTGVLLRRDFLQLLRDYAQPPTHPRGFLTPRQPLSLTDSQGIPLGYERSDKNSEFEAGQLFERYDKDHIGTLSMDKFLIFFNDFRTQLRSFVDDLSYASAHSEATARGVPKTDAPLTDRDPKATEARPSQTAARPPDAEKPATSVRAAYQATLWELRKICKDELQAQRERIVEAMDRLRARMASPPRSPRTREDPFAFRPTRLKASAWDNQIVDRYDALESDGERVGEILSLTRRQLRKGMDVSTKEMEDFLHRAPELMADARELAMKVYESHELESRTTRSDESKQRDEKDSQRRASVQSEDKEKDKSKDARPTQSVDELQKTLRIKDQIIYQLLQERTSLRKQKSAMETDLHDLTEMSTHEMRKWAQLTDDMQVEIARLRERLDHVEGR